MNIIIAISLHLFVLIAIIVFTFLNNLIKKEIEKNVTEKKEKNSTKIILFIIIQTIVLVIIIFFVMLNIDLFKLFYQQEKLKLSKNEFILFLITNTINNLIIFFIIFIMIIKKDKELISYLEFKDTFKIKNFKSFLILLLPLLIINLIEFLVSYYNHKNIVFNSSKLLNHVHFNNIFIAILNLMISAFLEEFVFRYYIPYIFDISYYKIIDFAPKNYKIYFSSILFSISHLISYKYNIIYSFPIFFLFSLYLFLIKKYCKSIIYCTFFHFLDNFLIGVSFFG